MLLELYHRKGGVTTVRPTREEIEILPVPYYERILNELLDSSLSEEELAKRTRLPVDKITRVLKNQILKYKMAKETEEGGVKRYAITGAGRCFIGAPLV